MLDTVESNHGDSRDKDKSAWGRINAHEEFSPPKLDLDSLKQVGQREVAGSGRKLASLSGYATGRVIMIDNVWVKNSISLPSLLGLKNLTKNPARKQAPLSGRAMPQAG